MAGQDKVNQIIENGYDFVDNMWKVKSMQQKFRESFNGTSIDTNEWDVATSGGFTGTVSGGLLTITANTTANAYYQLTSKKVFTIPCRALAGLQLSARQANQQVFVELISVDPRTLQPNGLSACAWRLDGGGTASQGIYEVQTGGNTRLASTACTTADLSVVNCNIVELEPFADECWFHSRVTDSSTGRTASYVRHQQIPDPNMLYKLRVRFLNNGTAPTTNAVTLKLQFLVVNDYAELTAEITAGRGNISAGQGIYATANIVNSYVPVRQYGTWKVETATNLAASATYTGTATLNGSSTMLYAPTIRVRCYAAQAGTLYVEQSKDTTVSNFRCPPAHVFTVNAGDVIQVDVPAIAYYYRIRYVNGATAQTAFEILTALVGV